MIMSRDFEDCFGSLLLPHVHLSHRHALRRSHCALQYGGTRERRRIRKAPPIWRSHRAYLSIKFGRKVRDVHRDALPPAQVPRHHPQGVRRELTQHCLTYLHQTILCRPYLGLEVTKNVGATAKKSREMVCRDWEVIYREAERNWAAYNRAV
ncbi:hypothetical protein IW261DRAFT_1502591 [Armillaria novae-zelandiae]|uniref:Uncharacterized protein n=1 Tax=Armillaria novae-zelandiae TaxID=153914 RepID=A0AA39NY24_9AGAR|nr:hypothetical protein IW261DRAFT_1502591 [Armillaria novae-zelandiae]